jgi:hypothetical protein
LQVRGNILEMQLSRGLLSSVAKEVEVASTVTVVDTSVFLQEYMAQVCVFVCVVCGHQRVSP